MRRSRQKVCFFAFFIYSDNKPKYVLTRKLDSIYDNGEILSAKRTLSKYVFVDDILREETLKYVEGCQAVSILSNSVIDDKMAASLKEMGVSFVTTRSTGIDHIHKDAVKKYSLSANPFLFISVYFCLFFCFF